MSSDTDLPRLLAGIPPHGALPLPEHLAIHGPLPHVDGPSRRGHSPLIELVEQAGLLGRGGASFPAAAKLRAVAHAGRPLTAGRPIVVVNAAEGEPASSKDRTLLRSLPHLVLDGAHLAALAVGAREIVIGVCETAPDALHAAAHAVAERDPRATPGSSTERHSRAGLGDEVRFELVPVPNTYVAGQESALINHLGGGPPLPTFTPPLPFERGLRRRPTLVSNVETLAHLALIARHGPHWFRQLGTPAQPGSALVTLSGPVGYPGVYEIEHGSPLSALIDAADGATAPLRAVLLGGYSGAFLDAPDVGSDLLSIPLSEDHLAPHGATLGAGVVVLLSTHTCPVAELARITRWLASQSARQCGPCLFGLDAIATTFEHLHLGDPHRGPALQGGWVVKGEQTVEHRLAELAALVNRRGACSHPDGAARLVSTALRVFADELDDHARHGPCSACARPSELPPPRRVPRDRDLASAATRGSSERRLQAAI
ncbi:MAG TPA: NADH-ubiquinone oxidoreductase-F iron-sulfur binding region domain-containing protein [Solirubrobacteraceae bacterium]|nr:NADH-ubiquinone oxidoreductase-F iron-sulfur binding region domain-containing protein [Solirubrobacteraceae bacterium]